MMPAITAAMSASMAASMGVEPALTPPPGDAFRLAPDEVHCWCARLDVPPETILRLYSSLSLDERQRLARLRFRRDQRRFIVAHGALRDILGRYLRTEPGRIRYARSASGKPRLRHGSDGGLEFNLSHSAELALIAVAAGSEVGVDIECIRAAPDLTEIARQFFLPAEAEALDAPPEHRQAEAFLRCWTRKEACLKACGGGLTLPLDSVAVPLATDAVHGPVELCVASSGIGRPTRWSVHTIEPAPGYVGALAIEGSGWRLRQWHWDLQSSPAFGWG